jgi:hypothetical protein
VTPGAAGLAAAVLADGDSAFGAGFVAFLVVTALCVACYFLFRSMNKHLRGLPTRFPPPSDDEATPRTDSIEDQSR